MFINAEENPSNFKEAILDEEWQRAIKTEINALEKQETWVKSKLPKGIRAIETRWVFTRKEDGRKKARLVAKGFQLKSNENQNVHSPVAKLSTIRMLLSKAVQENTNIRQLDIPTAFLNGMLESEVYIKIPEGIPHEGSKVFKLRRALYGLQESPKCWNDRFDKFVTSYGFSRSQYDFCLYFKQNC